MRGFACFAASLTAFLALPGVGTSASTEPIKVNPGQLVVVPVSQYSKVLSNTCGDGQPHKGPGGSAGGIHEVTRGSRPAAQRVGAWPDPGALRRGGGNLQIRVSPTATPGTTFVVDWQAWANGCFSVQGSATFKVATKLLGGPNAKIGPRQCTGPTPTYTKLMREPWRNSPKVRTTLSAATAKFQSNSEEAGKAFALDEFAITIEKMPPGLTAEQLLAFFARDPNGTVKDARFNFGSRFTRRGTGEPQVGEIYDINIPDIDKGGGSVMMVEKKPDHFVVQTIVTPQKGRHPVSGARQFGFTKNADGSVTFYTRGADRPDVEALRGAGRLAQNAVWTAMMEGLARQISAKGGKVKERTLPGSNGVRVPTIRMWRVDKKVGC